MSTKRLKSKAHDLSLQIKEEAKEIARQRDRKKVPLRIDSNTLLLVHPKNKNESYIQEYKMKLAKSHFDNNQKYLARLAID